LYKFIPYFNSPLIISFSLSPGMRAIFDCSLRSFNLLQAFWLMSVRCLSLLSISQSVCLSFIHSFVYCSNILMNMASHNSLSLNILKFYGNRRLVEIALVRKRQTTNSTAVKKLTSSPLAVYGVLCGINIYGWHSSEGNRRRQTTHARQQQPTDNWQQPTANSQQATAKQTRDSRQKIVFVHRKKLECILVLCVFIWVWSMDKIPTWFAYFDILVARNVRRDKNKEY